MYSIPESHSRLFALISYNLPSAKEPGSSGRDIPEALPLVVDTSRPSTMQLQNQWLLS